MQEEEESKLQLQKQGLLKTEVEDIHAEVSSKLSEYHKGKLFIGYLKILPMLVAGVYLFNTVLSYFDIDWPILSYIAQFILWLFVMIASYRLHFCEYHRMFLWYILTNNIICYIDSRWPLPISNWNYFVLHIIIAGVFLFLVLYYHQKCRKRNALFIKSDNKYI